MKLQVYTVVQLYTDRLPCTSYQQMSPCLMTSPLLGQQWSIRWLKRTFSLQQASPVDPVWVKGFRFGNWPQHWRSFFFTKMICHITLCHISYVHLGSQVGVISPSPRWNEKMSRFICVFIWMSTSGVHFDIKSPNESFSNWNFYWENLL